MQIFIVLLLLHCHHHHHRTSWDPFTVSEHRSCHSWFSSQNRSTFPEFSLYPIIPICVKFRLEVPKTKWEIHALPVQQYLGFWHSVIHLLLFTFQKPQIAAPCILSRFMVSFIRRDLEPDPEFPLKSEHL